MSDAEKPELRRANDNPWYCLATLHGEQQARTGENWDRDLAAKNRMAWNRWVAGILSDEQRADLASNGFSESELVPLNAAEKSAFRGAFASRTGREKELPPDPAEVFNFSHTHFDRVVIFRGFLWAGHANFSSATFSGVADFSWAKFSSLANFGSATFSEEAHFSPVTFSGLAGFNSATFSKDAHFSEATFSGFPEFKSATFFGEVEFSSTTFSHFANFSSAKFSKGADFSSATFSHSAHFPSATFSSFAFFGSAKFSGYADFRSATFLNAYFDSATFSHFADFHTVTFSGRADFLNAEFNANTIFAHVRFGTDVPDFRGAKMHEATEWHGVTWPPAPRDKDTAQDQVYAYERLKQEMERLKKHVDEQFFFRKELRARRGLLRFGSGAWILNFLYQASSEYGQGIAGPLLWLFEIFAIGSYIFATTAVFNGNHLTITRAAGLSFANIFSFLPIKREIMTPEMVAGLSNTAQVIGVVQSILGALLLFLIGLALRSRFRMR